jgi:hypothetical protein
MREDAFQIGLVVLQSLGRTIAGVDTATGGGNENLLARRQESRCKSLMVVSRSYQQLLITPVIIGSR